MRGGSEFRCHDVERGVDEGNDAGIALADTRGLDDDEIVSCARSVDDIGEVLGDLRAGLACGEGTEVDRAEIYRVHANAITEKCATTLATGRIHSDHGDTKLALLIEAEAAQ